MRYSYSWVLLMPDIAQIFEKSVSHILVGIALENPIFHRVNPHINGDRSPSIDGHFPVFPILWE